jgi:predicted PurR-regulated permease PerM
MAKKEVGISGIAVLIILAIIYSIHQICSQLFPFFIILLIFSIIVTIVVAIFQFEYWYVGLIVVAVVVVGSLITYSCGPGLVKTEIGKTLIDAGNQSSQALNTINEAKETAEELNKNVSKIVIDELVKSVQNNDSSLNSTVELSKRLIDLS